MTDTTKTEALRLADQAAGMSSKYTTPSYERGVLNGCVQELRRLSAVEAERDRLAAECEALRADAGRYRWLRKMSDTMFVSVKINGDGPEIAETLDAAIDAARAKR